MGLVHVVQCLVRLPDEEAVLHEVLSPAGRYAAQAYREATMVRMEVAAASQDLDLQTRNKDELERNHESSVEILPRREGGSSPGCPSIES